MAEKFDEFIADVEDNIRQERYEHLWKKYGKFVVATVTTVLTATALYNFWHYRITRQASQFSSQLIDGSVLLAEGRTAEGMSLLKPLADQSHDTYAVLSLFAQAGALHIKNAKEDQDKALAIYERLHGHKEHLFRDLSYVYAGYLKLNRNPDAAALEKIRGDLEKIAKDSPVRGLANEAVAMTWLFAKQHDKAIPLLTAIIQNPSSSKQLSNRAQLMLQHANTHTAG